jgi:hypothetical protein
MNAKKNERTSTVQILDIVVTILFYAMIINAALLIWDLFDEDAIVSGLPVQYSVTDFGEIDSWTGSMLDVKLDQAEDVWQIEGPPLYMKVVLLFFELIRLGLFIFIVFLFRKIIHSFKDTGPFIYENVKRLKKISFTFISLDVYYYLLGIISFFWLHPKSGHEEISIYKNIGLDLKYIFIGILIYAIAEIFRVGAQLKKEQELTI